MGKVYAVREYKDTLFRFIFKEKDHLPALYNALNHSNYSNSDDLEVVTLENIFFLKMKNDVAFIINTDELCLVEHASTVCYNYPLRGLLYIAREYENILARRGVKLQRRTLIRIPMPRYVVLYNGIEKRSERETYLLSDAFDNRDVEACLELKAEIININYGMNRELLSACKILNDYAILISKVREYRSHLNNLAGAISRAVDYCIEEGHLRELLTGYRAEVEAMLLSQGSIEDYIEDLEQEKDRIIQEQAEQIQEQANQIQEQTEQIQGQTEQIQEQANQIYEQAEQIQELSGQLQELQEKMAQLTNR